jgi:Transcriptional regulator containing PAS, AAA-type ATPase, and DNA-binding domains
LANTSFSWHYCADFSDVVGYHSVSIDSFMVECYIENNVEGCLEMIGGVQMETLISLDQDKILKAWFSYVKDRTVREDLLRPVIARSWKRSPNLGYNSVKPLAPTPSEKQDVLAKANADLILAATPVMEYLLNIDDNRIVLLTDKYGYTIKALHRYRKHIVDNTCYNEDYIGCNTIGIILKEGNPASVCGYEHLTANWHSVLTGGVPIKNLENEIIGVLVVSYPFNKPPHASMQSIIKAGKLIEANLVCPAKTDFEETDEFSLLLDQAPYSLLVVNSNGQIENANKHFLEKFEVYDYDLIRGSHIKNFIDDEEQKIIMLEEYNRQDSLSIHTQNKSMSFKISNIKKVKNNNQDHRIIYIDNLNVRNNRSILSIASSTKGVDTNSEMDEIVGSSQPIINLKKLIKKISRVNSTVLIQGESGTGKELVARAIHAYSSRKGEFIAVNCGAIPKELIESELFGYTEGTFTGGMKGGKPGKFELANYGTLFLDEIGEMPVDMQVALLRALETKTVYRVGSSVPIKLDIRIISATNKDLIASIADKSFREDLYYRLNVINVQLSPLREILEDIPLIARNFLNRLCRQFDMGPMKMELDAEQVLCRYDWPGNVRELRNIMERAVVYSDGSVLTKEIINYCLTSSSPIKKTNSHVVDNYDHEMLCKNLKKNNWNISQTAKYMGISRSNLYQMIKKQNINIEEIRNRI